jgi:hypothetical protein
MLFTSRPIDVADRLVACVDDWMRCAQLRRRVVPSQLCGSEDDAGRILVLQRLRAQDEGWRRRRT